LDNGELWYRVVKANKNDVVNTSPSEAEPDAHVPSGHVSNWRRVIRTDQEKNTILHGLHTSRLGK